MKHYLSLLLLLVLSSPLFAADDTAKVKLGWEHNIIAGLTLTQVSYTDWVAGGENALAYNASVIGKSVNEEPMTSWTTNYKLSFGQAEISHKGLRKTDDAINLETIFAYKLNTHVNPYIAAAVSSQFTNGYQYTDTSRTAISTFLDPLYAREGIGFGFNLDEHVKTRIGFALRETFTNTYTRWADDPKTPEIETTRIEGGLEWVTDAQVKIEENVFFKSHLETFAGLKTFTKWVIYSENLLTAKISDHFNVQLGVAIRYDEFIIARTQIKEGLALGVSYQLL